MLKNIMSQVMGSTLTKNYEVDKDPYMHGGLHNLWKIYRAKKKDRNNMDCSLFIFDKKQLDKKKLSQTQRDEICNILKKDPQNLTRLKHPNLLSLLEQPQEDQKYIVFATEPIEYNLSSLVFDATKKELIPGDLEIKCLSLELLEALNFLHNNAKNMHMGLAPEHVYINKEGKLKLGGMNFAQQFSTSESLNVPLNFDLKINEMAVVPNMRFAAPELSDKQMCSFNTDLFSVGCLLFFMVSLSKNRDPFLLNQKDISDRSSHSFEIKSLERKFSSLMAGVESDFESLMRQLCNINNPDLRGPLNEVVNKAWFQDPLLKTIKYLETIDSRDFTNKVQFLTGVTSILQKFDKKALIKKVIPLLLDQMKEIKLSVNVLPNILDVMERPNYLTTSEFREYIWPSLQKLCKAKELPAQSLYLILKNTELFMKFVGPQEFQSNFLILINKSLECGVPKLQFLALTKVPIMIKQLDYQVVKQQILPRVLILIEKSSQLQLKQKTLEILNEIIPGIDQQTMKDKILKTFEKIRSTETDPQVCMLMLKIYEQMAKTLGVDEIGHKILPGIIPMLISGTFTRIQFTEMMQSVRRLLDQIEKHKEKDLRDMGQETLSEKLEFDEKPSKQASISNPTNKDVFDFLGTLDGGSGMFSHQQKSTQPAQSLASNMTQGFGGLNLGGMSGQTSSNDPFAEILGSNSAISQPKTNFGSGGGWDTDLPSLNEMKPQPQNSSQGTSQNAASNFGNEGWASFGQSNASQPVNNNMPFSTSTAPNLTNNFNNFGNSNSGGGFASNTNNMGFGSVNLGQQKPSGGFSSSNDPFADLINNDTQAPQTNFGGSTSGAFGNMNLNQGIQNNNFNQNAFGSSQQTNVNNNMNFGFNTGASSNFNNQFGGQSNSMNFGNQATSLQQNNNGFGTFGQNNNTNTFGATNSLQQNNSNPLANLNFGMPNTAQNNFSQGFNMGGSVNLGFNNNPFGGVQQNQTNSNLGQQNDDFFSQFTNSNKSTQQQNNFNPF